MERLEITEFTARVIAAGLETQFGCIGSGMTYLVLDHETVRRVALTNVPILIPVGTLLRIYVETGDRPLREYERADIAQVDVLDAEGVIIFQIFMQRWALDEFRRKTSFNT